MTKKSGEAAARKSIAKAAPKRKIDTRPIKVASVRRLSERAVKTVREHSKLLFGITAVYALLDLVFVRGLSGGVDFSNLRSALSQVSTGHVNALASSVGSFIGLIGSAGNTTDAAGSAYQGFLIIIASLALIWALRQVLSGARPTIRDAYYKSMYPLVPFLLVLFVVSLQLVPLVIGSTLYVLVINNGIAVYALEKILWGLLFVVLAAISLYMVSSSIFALYIVTLQGMTPLKALRSARELVRGRRWVVLRKLLYLPLILLIVAAVIMLPVIMVATILAQWVFFALAMLALLAAHAYLYTLYRELLNE